MLISTRIAHLLPALLLVFGACSRPPESDFVAMNAPPHAVTVKQPSDVEIIATGVPTRPYTEIGYFQAWRGTGDLTALYTHVRGEGFKHGCDAVVITDKNKYAVASASGATEQTGSINAVCIMFLNETESAGGRPPIVPAEPIVPSHTESPPAATPSSGGGAP